MKKYSNNILKNVVKVFGLILFSISIFLNFFFYNKLQKNESSVKILGVIDGDTIVLENKTRLRLRQLDAPELKYCGGQEAKALLEDLLSQRQIVIRDQIPDQYGRSMALIYVGNTFVNQELLASGWVRFHHDQTSQNESLRKIADQARSQSLGVYSSLCYQKNPPDPKCDIKGNIDKNSGKKKYYYPGCNQYNFTIVEKDIGENWFCSEEDAQKAGFQKAETCKVKRN